MSLIDDGVKVKLVFWVVVPARTGATGVMVMSLYGGKAVASKINGAVDDKVPDWKKVVRVADDGVSV